ncbi:MAG: metallothionein [Candidatus Caenarcaniphilales bacterium]|nr:metallothionein [Candidatus Caenarcaniphilales bacterium]
MNQTIEVTQVKCACPNCLCVVSTDQAVKGNDGRFYCSESCSQGHKTDKGCHHHGCKCG